MGRWIIILIVALVFVKTMNAQAHYSYTSNTGNNATIGIPISINPTADGNPLAVNDEIAVFADGRVMSDSFCVGAAVWTGKNISITVWGDNDQTAFLDGIKGGTKYHFHIWKTAANKEYTTTVVTYSQGDSLYRANGVYVLASLYAGVHQGTSSILVETAIGKFPHQCILEQNYPNPFNPVTMFTYAVFADTKIKIEVFNMLGQLISVPVDGVKHAGSYQMVFDGRNLSSGLYLYRMTAGSYIRTMKMQLVQ
jgi:hypothetical protein